MVIISIFTKKMIFFPICFDNKNSYNYLKNKKMRNLRIKKKYYTEIKEKHIEKNLYFLSKMFRRTIRNYFLVSCEGLCSKDETKFKPINYTATITKEELNKKFNPENIKIGNRSSVVLSMNALENNFDLTIDNNTIEQAFQQNIKLDSIISKETPKNKLYSLFLLPSLLLPNILFFAFPLAFVYCAVSDLQLPEMLKYYEKTFDKKFTYTTTIEENVNASYLISISGNNCSHTISLKVKDSKYYLYDCKYGLFETDNLQKVYQFMYYLTKQYTYLPFILIYKIQD